MKSKRTNPATAPPTVVMTWGLLRSLLFVCWWCAGVGVSGQKVKLADKAAQIAVSVMNVTSGSPFNTSYIFGVYGHNSLTVPASGQLVHVRSEGDVNHGCDDYNHDLPTHDWVALIERGSCYFQAKVTMATKRYNASAVVVYNDEPSQELVMMRSTVRDEVYVFVTQSYGRWLALLVDSGLHVRLNITFADVPSSSSSFFFFSARRSPLSLFLPLLLAVCLLPSISSL